MRLHLDSVPEANIRERAIALQRVASLAASGSCGLARLLTGETIPDVRPLLQDGKKFLEKVLSDIERYREGVDPWSKDAKVYYHPEAILQAFGASVFRQRNVAEEETVKMAEERIVQSARKLLSAFSDILGNEKGLSPESIVHYLQEYREISAPYLILTSQATEEFKRGSFASISRPKAS